MNEITPERLLIEVFNWQSLLDQERGRELLHVEGKHFLGCVVLVDQCGKAGKEIWITVAQVVGKNTLIELV